MAWTTHVQDEIRRNLVSPWALVLGAALFVTPLFLGIALATMPSSISPGPNSALLLLGQVSGLLMGAMVLVALAASGAWSDPPSVRAALLGRFVAVAIVVALGWGIPALSIMMLAVGSAGLVPFLIHFLSLTLEALAWVAILTLTMEMARRRPAIAAVSVFLALALVVPMALLFVYRLGFTETSAEWGGPAAVIMGFLSPGGTMEALRAAFSQAPTGLLAAFPEAPPRPGLGVTLAIALAWVAIPAFLASRADPLTDVEAAAPE